MHRPPESSKNVFLFYLQQQQQQLLLTILANPHHFCMQYALNGGQFMGVLPKRVTIFCLVDLFMI